ncbi:hypothetical protein CXG81DRAFT_21330 [Caulochytrium protostelioides]|uniref:Protein kinase domain-containing protein n=1 Tax=Caulochytrium protostelioides TaxID=1555241 RepID=A0A4P9X0E3_9FUNG|nr:hypothetical protein CXG81DRAFT_21330 [Caulochytrium protostelioides]|eukprot:RKO98432.1 hypothetical protein CXG81DRAFT_21330 [Caulochytrium protostelioides]
MGERWRVTVSPSDRSLGFIVDFGVLSIPSIIGVIGILDILESFRPPSPFRALARPPGITQLATPRSSPNPAELPSATWARPWYNLGVPTPRPPSGFFAELLASASTFMDRLTPSPVQVAQTPSPASTLSPWPTGPALVFTAQHRQRRPSHGHGHGRRGHAPLESTSATDVASKSTTWKARMRRHIAASASERAAPPSPSPMPSPPSSPALAHALLDALRASVTRWTDAALRLSLARQVLIAPDTAEHLSQRALAWLSRQPLLGEGAFCRVYRVVPPVSSSSSSSSSTSASASSLAPPSTAYAVKLIKAARRHDPSATRTLETEWQTAQRLRRLLADDAEARGRLALPTAPVHVGNPPRLVGLKLPLATHGTARDFAATHLRAAPRPAAARILRHLLADTARALATLHALDVVHGDIADRNVLVTWRDGRLRAVLADWGLAVGGLDAAAARALSGTPPFMDPTLVGVRFTRAGPGGPAAAPVTATATTAAATASETATATATATATPHARTPRDGTTGGIRAQLAVGEAHLLTPRNVVQNAIYGLAIVWDRLIRSASPDPDRGLDGDGDPGRAPRGGRSPPARVGRPGGAGGASGPGKRASMAPPRHEPRGPSNHVLTRSALAAARARRAQVLAAGQPWPAGGLGLIDTPAALALGIPRRFVRRIEAMLLGETDLDDVLADPYLADSDQAPLDPAPGLLPTATAADLPGASAALRWPTPQTPNPARSRMTLADPLVTRRAGHVRGSDHEIDECEDEGASSSSTASGTPAGTTPPLVAATAMPAAPYLVLTALEHLKLERHAARQAVAAAEAAVEGPSEAAAAAASEPQAGAWRHLPWITRGASVYVLCDVRLRPSTVAAARLPDTAKLYTALPRTTSDETLVAYESSSDAEAADESDATAVADDGDDNDDGDDGGFDASGSCAVSALAPLRPSCRVFAASAGTAAPFVCVGRVHHVASAAAPLVPLVDYLAGPMHALHAAAARADAPPAVQAQWQARVAALCAALLEQDVGITAAADYAVGSAADPEGRALVVVRVRPTAAARPPPGGPQADPTLAATAQLLAMVVDGGAPMGSPASPSPPPSPSRSLPRSLSRPLSRSRSRSSSRQAAPLVRNAANVPDDWVLLLMMGLQGQATRRALRLHAYLAPYRPRPAETSASASTSLRAPLPSLARSLVK